MVVLPDTIAGADRLRDVINLELSICDIVCSWVVDRDGAAGGAASSQDLLGEVSCLGEGDAGTSW